MTKKTAKSGAQVKYMRINCATLRAMPSALKGLISEAIVTKRCIEPV